MMMNWHVSREVKVRETESQEAGKINQEVHSTDKMMQKEQFVIFTENYVYGRAIVITVEEQVLQQVEWKSSYTEIGFNICSLLLSQCRDMRTGVI